MKILHLANVGGETRGGGVHEVAYNFYLYQRGLGINAQLWFPGTQEEREFYADQNNIKVKPTYFNPNYGLMKELWNREEVMDFDLIHQHGIYLPTSLISNRFRASKRGPVIIQPHGYLEPYRVQISKLKKGIARFLYEDKNLNNAELILACSEPEFHNLKNVFPHKNIATISNGVQNEFVQQPTSNEWVDPFPDKRKMLFLSRIHPLKGIPRFLKVLSQLDEKLRDQWAFIIAGFEEIGHEAELKMIIKKLNLEHMVRFVGPKFGQEKIDIMSKCDLFVLPTFNENYGIVVAEALARGTVVLTTMGTPWEELKSRNCGFWAENSEEGIKNELEVALRMSDDELREMGERGKQLVLEKYTWEKTTLLTKELYTWLLGGGEKPDFVG